MQISPNQVSKARSAWLGLGGFEGPQQMEGGNPNCILYVRRLTVSGVSVFVNDCYESTPNGVKNSIYQVLLINWNEGRRPEVQAEIDNILEEIRVAIERELPGVNVTKGARLTPRPF